MKKLTTTQQYIAEAIAEGKQTIDEIAEVFQVSVRSIYRWQNIEEFKVAVEEAKAPDLEKMIRSLNDKEKKKLWKMLDSGEEKIGIKEEDPAGVYPLIEEIINKMQTFVDEHERSNLSQLDNYLIEDTLLEVPYMLTHIAIQILKMSGVNLKYDIEPTLDELRVALMEIEEEAPPEIKSTLNGGAYGL